MPAAIDLRHNEVSLDALGEEAWAAALAAGRALSLERAIVEALGEADPRSDEDSVSRPFVQRQRLPAGDIMHER